MQSWMISIVISFVLRQLAKFTTSLDWAKVAEDLDKRVRDLIPGKWLDDEGSSVALFAFNSIRAVLMAQDKIKPILELLAHQKYTEAALLLKKLLKERLDSQVLTAEESQFRDYLTYA